MGFELYNLPFYNNSGETIPPFAVMQVEEWKDDVNDRDYFRVRKPNGSGKQYIVNGPLSIPAGSDGLGSRSPGIQASYNNAATPAVDEEWGPVNGSWLLTSGGTGYYIVGDIDSIGGVNVVRASESKSDSGRVIRVQVSESGGVTGADSIVNWDNPIAIVGPDPPSTGTFNNAIYQQTYADNDVVFLNWNKNTEEWEPERGGTAGSRIFRFEATAAKDWNTGTVAGTLLDSADSPVGGAITLTDRAPAKHEMIDGSRGWCLLDGSSTYWVLSVDSPARWVEGALNADWEFADPSGVIALSDFWGAAPNHLEPESSSVTIYDADKLYRSGKLLAGKKIRGLWDEKRKKYFLASPSSTGDYVTIKGTCGITITRATTSFTLIDPVSVNGPVPPGTITVFCDPKIDCPNGTELYARYNVTKGAGPVEEMWDTGDTHNHNWIMRGYPDFDSSKKQLFTSDGGTLEWNEIATVLNWLAGYVAGNDQSIGHDASDVTEWQDDSLTCPP